MVTLNWSDTLSLDFPPIDDLHRHLVEQMVRVEDCTDAHLCAEWTQLVAQAQTLFECEDHWMQASHFASAPNHTLQHRVVLNLLREGLGQARAGEVVPVRLLSVELGHWLAKHIQSLDAALALHMRRHPELTTHTTH
jgi:hemerythrin-like metal-binding protein